MLSEQVEKIHDDEALLSRDNFSQPSQITPTVLRRTFQRRLHNSGLQETVFQKGTVYLDSYLEYAAIPMATVLMIK